MRSDFILIAYCYNKQISETMKVKNMSHIIFSFRLEVLAFI